MTDYKEAGVNLAEADKAVSRIGELAAETYTKDVIAGVGGFSGLFSAKSLKQFKEPVLVSSIDGVGTKVKVARAMNYFRGLGIDVVNHCSNDVGVTGAKPLFFLDYIASSRLDAKVVAELVGGMAYACKKIGVSLIGGETAEMPSVYNENESDVVGVMVGAVERSEILDGSKVKEGDVLVGLPSNGLHTNGFSLARKVLLEDAGMDPKAFVEGLGLSLGEELLRPHISYVGQIALAKEKHSLKAAAHITGGGFQGNIPRVLPKGFGAEIEKQRVPVQPIFRLIQEKGNIAEEEMFRTFNMGIGLVMVVPEKNAESLANEIRAEFKKAPEIIGKVIKGHGVTFK